MPGRSGEMARVSLGKRRGAKSPVGRVWEAPGGLKSGGFLAGDAQNPGEKPIFWLSLLTDSILSGYVVSKERADCGFSSGVGGDLTGGGGELTGCAAQKTGESSWNCAGCG